MATRPAPDKPQSPGSAGDGSGLSPDPAGSMAEALERVRGRRAASSDYPAHRAHEGTNAGQRPPGGPPGPGNGVSGDGAELDQGPRPGTRGEPSDDDDFFDDLGEDVPSGEVTSDLGPDGHEPADDPVVFHLEDGTPVRRSEARGGYLRRRDYSAKTEQLSEVRRKAEQAESEAHQAREHFGQRLQALVELERASMPQLPDPALKQTDPLLWQEKWAEHYAAQESIRAKEAELVGIAQEHARRHADTLRARIAEEQQRMIDRIPAMKKVRDDPEKLGAIFSRYRTAGKKLYGFTDQEFNSLTDHRLMVLLDDALRGRALRRRGGNGQMEGSGRTVTLKGTGSGGYQRPGTSVERKLSEATANLRKAHDMNSAMEVLKARREAKRNRMGQFRK